MDKVEINGTQHPIFFDWLAIENISEFVGDNSLDSTAKKLNSYVTSLKFTRFVAFEGIKCGYKKIGETCPFKDSDELAEAVKNYSELSAIVPIYTKSVSEFYATEDAELVETEKKK